MFRHGDLGPRNLDVEPQQPGSSTPRRRAGRSSSTFRPANSLEEHQVHERAWLVVLGGTIEIDGPDGESAQGGPGLLAVFDPNERHEVRATEDARLLLLLSPWPGEGHPSNALDSAESKSEVLLEARVADRGRLDAAHLDPIARGEPRDRSQHRQPVVAARVERRRREGRRVPRTTNPSSVRLDLRADRASPSTTAAIRSDSL